MPIQHIVYIGDLFGFPDGQAGSNYIRLICRGLIHAGCRARVLIPNPTEDPAKPVNTRISGAVDGIDFEYTTGTTIHPPTRLRLKWSRMRGRYGTQVRLVQLKILGELDCLILYSRSYRRLMEMKRICSFLKIPLVVHLTEWYTVLRQDQVYPSARENRDVRLFHNEVIQHIDAAIVISQYLEDLVYSISTNANTPLPLINIPVLADLQKVARNEPVRRDRPYLMYCASLDAYIKDALFIIRAAARLKMDALDMVMVGSASPATRELLQRTAKESGFTGKMDLKCSFVPEEDLYGLYAGAAALVAPLQENVESKARFPFKLAGYLAAGRPVVSCQVGEVSRYLEDGRSAYLSRAGDLEHFSEKIMEALSSPEREQVARAGRRVAQQYFDYQLQGEKLAAFIRELILAKRGVR